MQSFKNVEEFYSENSAGLRSPAADYGVHWKLEGWPNSFRVSYVRDTGEIYAVQQGPIPSGILPTGEIIITTRPEATGPEEGPVLLLGHFPIDEEAGPRDVYYLALNPLYPDGIQPKCSYFYGRQGEPDLTMWDMQSRSRRAYVIGATNHHPSK